MRSILLAPLLLVAACAASPAPLPETRQDPAPREVVLTLSPAEIDVLGRALMDQDFRDRAALVQKLKTQLDAAGKKPN